MEVDKNWWKNLFDETYLLTDARSVCNEELTSQEIDFLCDTLRWSKSSSILDLCGGQGRHSLELSKRNFKNVIALDYSKYLLDLGNKRAKEKKLNTAFIQSDARNIGLIDRSFHFIIIMASSFGYFVNDEENEKILKEIYRLLISNGTMLLDLPDKDYILQNFQPISSHKVNADITVTRIREIDNDIIYSQETVMSQKQGCIRNRTYCIRLYSFDKIADLIYSAGFSSIHCKKNFMNRIKDGDFGCMTNRMIVTAKKDTKR